MEITNGFFAEMLVFAGVFISKMALSTRDEVEKLVSVVRRIDEEGVEVESQDGEGWGFLATSHPSLYTFLGFGVVWSFSLLVLPDQFFGVQVFGRFP